MPLSRPTSPARKAPFGEPEPYGRPGRWELGVALCTAAVASFLTLRLDAWPPHEDETLALFVGRDSIGGLFDTVLGDRGGAPLHFLVAWVVAHLGGGLTALRACSAAFAVLSVPVVALLGERLAGRKAAFVATVIVSASWMFLFYGAYGRMYSLFLLTSAGSYLAYIRAVRRFRPLDWSVWASATYFTIAAHPYGALVLLSQAVFLLVDRTQVRAAGGAFVLVAILGIPFWRSDLVLAGRYDVGLAGGEGGIGGADSLPTYLWRTAADFASGSTPILVLALLFAGAGLLRLRSERPQSALLVAAAAGIPILALLVSRFGSGTSPETRHLIFVLPFFAVCLAVGLLRLGPIFAAVAICALVPAEIAWGHHRTPQLYDKESRARVQARDAASGWLARTSRPDDVLFGYDPLFLQAWARGGDVSRTVVPRADGRLMLEALENAPTPLGRGVWVFDASDFNNDVRRLTIPLRRPYPASAFVVRTFGPFLVIRSRRPTRTVYAYLAQTWDVQLVGKELRMGDAYVNYGAVRRAIRRLAVRP